MKKILYVGWIGFNNFGDEWMWNIFQQMCNHYLEPNQYQIIPLIPQFNLNELFDSDTIVLGGGSLLAPGYYVDMMYQATKDHKRTLIWGNGHDQFNSLFMNDNQPFSLEPIDHNAEYLGKIQEIIHNAAYCGIRGPWTQDYLKKCGVSLEHVTISGDPAMLTLPPVLDKSHECSPKRWIGINWGTSYNRIYGQNEENVEDMLALAAQHWIQQGYNLCIYIVWTKDLESAQRLQQKIGSPEHVVLDPQIHTLESYLELMSKFTFTVNLKLHANILSAAANVPFICLGYRFKCYDFMHSLNLLDTIIPTDCPQMEEALIHTAAHILNHKDSIIEHFHQLRQRVTNELKKPFVKDLFS